jgi:hypothetical protein
MTPLPREIGGRSPFYPAAIGRLFLAWSRVAKQLGVVGSTADRLAELVFRSVLVVK